MNWRIARTLGLWGLILGDIGMLVIMGFNRQFYWLTVFSVITATIIIAEIVSYLALKKTISTQYGQWIKSKPVPALIALALFLFAMFSLAIHLVGYAFP